MHTSPDHCLKVHLDDEKQKHYKYSIEMALTCIVVELIHIHHMQRFGQQNSNVYRQCSAFLI